MADNACQLLKKWCMRCKIFEFLHNFLFFIIFLHHLATLAGYKDLYGQSQSSWNWKHCLFFPQYSVLQLKSLMTFFWIGFKFSSLEAFKYLLVSVLWNFTLMELTMDVFFILFFLFWILELMSFPPRISF